MEQFTITSFESIKESAEHFGIAVENFASSAPLIGIEAVNIAQAGLTIVMRDSLNSDVNVYPKHLMAYTYDNKPALKPTREEILNWHVFPISDPVLEFALSRNLKPLTVVKAGMNLLNFAAGMDISPGNDIKVYKNRVGSRKGKLDSVLALSISPLNTVTIERRRPSISARLRNK